MYRPSQVERPAVGLPPPNKLFFTILSKTLSAKRGIANGHLLRYILCYVVLELQPCFFESRKLVNVSMLLRLSRSVAQAQMTRGSGVSVRVRCKSRRLGHWEGKTVDKRIFANIQYSPESRYTFFCGAFSVRHVRLPD